MMSVSHKPADEQDAQLDRLRAAIENTDEELRSLLAQLGFPNRHTNWIWQCHQCQEINVIEESARDPSSSAHSCGYCQSPRRLDHQVPAAASSRPQQQPMTTTATFAPPKPVAVPVQPVAPASSRWGPAVTTQPTTQAPAEANSVASASGWKCTACTTVNADNEAECQTCYADRAPQRTAVETWKCSACLSSNELSARECIVCCADRPTDSGKQGWRCDACTSENSESATECDVCSADRPASTGESSGRGEWKCSACMSLNAAEAIECSECYAEKEQKEESSKVGWVCSACTTRNDASAVECQVCYADRDGTQTVSKGGAATREYESDHIDLSVGNRELVDTAARVDELFPVPTNPERIKKLTLKTKSFNQETAVIVAERLRMLRNLEIADFSDIIAGRPTDVGLAVIGTLCDALPSGTIREFNVSDNALGERGIRVLSKTLARLSPTVEILSFRNDGLSEKSMQLLVEALGSPMRLQAMHFFSNMSGNGGAIALVPLLRKLGEVKDLPFRFTMSSCRVLAEGSVALCQGLSHVAHRLEYLDLSDCQLPKNGAVELGKVLQNAPNIKHLNLKDIGVEGAASEPIVTAFGNLRKLEFLDFSSGPLKTKQVKQLIDLVQKTCTQLQVLRLAENEAKSKGVADLLTNLSSLPQLKELDLRSNELEDDDALRLFRALSGRSAFERLELGGNDLSDNAINQLEKGLGTKLGLEAEKD